MCAAVSMFGDIPALQGRVLQGFGLCMLSCGPHVACGCVVLGVVLGAVLGNHCVVGSSQLFGHMQMSGYFVYPARLCIPCL